MRIYLFIMVFMSGTVFCQKTQQGDFAGAPELLTGTVQVPFEYKDETFLKVYKSLVFENNPKNNDGKIYHRYWKEPVKVYFAPSIPKSSRKNLIRFAAEISKGIDSLNIRFVDELEKSNMVIYQAGDFMYESRLNPESHDYFLYWNDLNHIFKASLQINPQLAFTQQLYDRRLEDMFLTALGYFTLTDDIACTNYFSNCYDENKKFSELDYQLLKYHYSYGICKGVDEETFDDLHKMANDLKKDKPGQKLTVTHKIYKKR